MSGLNRGRQAQMMPTLDSTAVQIRVVTPPYVGSGDFDVLSIVVMRTIVQIQTLEGVSVIWGATHVIIDLQATKAKDREEPSLLSCRYLQALDQRHGQE